MASEIERIPRNGLTIRELSARTGYSPRTIRRWTSEPREVYLGRAQQKRERVQELRAQGMTIRAIADKLGCSVGTVHRYTKMHMEA